MLLRDAEHTMIGQRRDRTCAFETREGVTDNVIAGHATVFDEIAHNEVIRPGACDGALRRIGAGEDRAYAYWNHNSDMVIGATENDTLSLEVDARGLVFAATTPDTQAGRDAVTLIRAGYVSRMSFGFIPLEERSVKDDAGEFLYWEVLALRLLEVSPVPFAWYEGTDVGVRSRALDEARRALDAGDIIAARELIASLDPERRASDNSSGGGRPESDQSMAYGARLETPGPAPYIF